MSEIFLIAALVNLGVYLIYRKLMKQAAPAAADAFGAYRAPSSFCTQCGAPTGEQAFCGGCGTRVGGGAA